MPTYDFNSNNMQSTVISITCQSQSMAPKQWCQKDGTQINTPLIGPEVWLSTMGKTSEWVKGRCHPHQHPSFTSCHKLWLFLPLCQFAPWLIHPLCLAVLHPSWFISWLVRPLADSPPHLGRFALVE